VKHVSKKVRGEIKAERRKVIDQVVASIIPVERQTPEMMKSVVRMIEEVSVLDGAAKKLDTLLEDEVPEIKEKLKSTPFYMRKVFENAAKKLPHHPGGRKRTLSDKKCLDIIEDIASRVRNGLELRQSKEQVARKHSVSLSSVQRVWKLRGVYARKSSK
jgi:hypothetical protein